MNNKELNKAFKELIKKYEELKKDALNFKQTIQDNLITSITKLETGKNEQQEQLKDIIKSINDKTKKLDDYYKKLFEDDNSIEKNIAEMEKQITDYHTKLIKGEDKSDSIQADISNIYKKINNYKKELFGYKEKDENDEIITHPGIKDEIDELLKKYSDKIDLFEKNSNELIDKKAKEMNVFLKKMGLNYNSIEQEALSKKYFLLARKKGRSIVGSTVLLIIFSLIFSGTLVFLFIDPTVRELLKNTNLFTSLFIRFVIPSPIIYLIVSTAHKRKREIIINDQYNYKGAIMSTYRNISTHIKNEELEISSGKQTDLLEKTFNKILENESDKLETSNQNNLEQFNKFIDNFSKLLGTNKKILINILPEFFKRISDETNKINPTK